MQRESRGFIPALILLRREGPLEVNESCDPDNEPCAHHASEGSAKAPFCGHNQPARDPNFERDNDHAESAEPGEPLESLEKGGVHEDKRIDCQHPPEKPDGNAVACFYKSLYLGHGPRQNTTEDEEGSQYPGLPETVEPGENRSVVGSVEPGNPSRNEHHESGEGGANNHGERIQGTKSCEFGIAEEAAHEYLENISQAAREEGSQRKVAARPKESIAKKVHRNKNERVINCLFVGGYRSRVGSKCLLGVR